MKCHVSKLLMALGLAGAATAASALEWAATNETINFPFRPDNAVQTLTARVDAYSNSTMGFKGWTHHSSWLYMKLKKGASAFSMKSSIRVTLRLSRSQPSPSVSECRSDSGKPAKTV